MPLTFLISHIPHLALDIQQQQHFTMVSIDHTSYPEIIDHIISHASNQALFNLRGTSKTFRRRVDAEVGTHALLGGDKPRRTLYVPLQNRFPSPPRTWVLTTLPAEVRTLDVDFAVLNQRDTNENPIFVPRFMDEIFLPFKAVRTVRRFHTSLVGFSIGQLFPPSARTVVDYIQLKQAKPYPAISLIMGRQHIVHLRVCTLTKAVTKGFPERVTLGVADSQGLYNVTLVLSVARDAGDTRSSSVTMRVLLVVMARILNTRPLRFFVVGLEQIFPPQPSMRPGSIPSAATEYTTIVDYLERKLAYNPPGTRVDLRFFTGDEWRSELNPTEKELFAEWPSDYDAGLAGSEGLSSVVME